jgi:hypothetical protein
MEIHKNKAPPDQGGKCVRFVSKKAALWLLRSMDEPEMDLSDRNRFLDWLRRSPDNVAEFLRILAVDNSQSTGVPKLEIRLPRVVYDRLLQRFLRPAAYQRYVEPHIEDMHTEYFACIAARNERGARRAVIRAHLYVIPSWAWALVASLIARVIEWMRT